MSTSTGIALSVTEIFDQLAPDGEPRLALKVAGAATNELADRIDELRAANLAQLHENDAERLVEQTRSLRQVAQNLRILEQHYS